MSFGKAKEDSDDKRNVAGGLRPTFPTNVSSAAADAVLGKGSKVVGALTFTGSVEIDCEVEGEIQSKERLTIGESALVKAKVHGTDVIVRGTVIGDIVATRTLQLKKPARVSGNISAPSLSIEEGVLFEGKCAMAAATAARPAEIKVAAQH
jgi:cytoskeletal protein CcmA (bactofilin family)